MKKDKNNKSQGSFIGLVPLLVFLIIYFVMGISTGSFDNLPLMIGMFIATAVGLHIKSPVAHPTTYEERVNMYCEGGGDKTLILMVIIYMLAGAFYGVAGAMHATDTVTNLGISILPARMILPGLFLIGCVLSFSMGTSMGTVSALIPIGIGIAEKTGVSLPLVAGVVVGGAMFGDNLSFISDTTIAATTTQGVEMRDKFKANIKMVLPAVLVTVIALSFVPINVTTFEMGESYPIINLLPYVAIIGFSLAGLHVIPAMTLSVLIAAVIGIIHGDFTFVESFTVIHTGMTWMEDMAVIAILVGGVIALMNYLGGIDYLLSRLGKNTKTRVGGELSIALLVFLVDIFTTNNTLAIIASGPIAKDISTEYEIPPARTASILDIFSSAGNGITPYAGQLLVASAMCKISPVSIMPYVWYSWLMLVFGIIFIVIGYPKKVVNK